MRFEQFKIDEKQKLKEKYPHLTEQQLDEILPALGAAAGAVGKVAAKGAMAAGKVGAKMGAKVAGQAGKLAAKGVKAGTSLATKAGKAVGQGLAKKAQKVGQKVGDMAAQQLLKPGSKLSIGGQEVVVDKAQGNDVTIADPKDKNAPKTVIQKKHPLIKQALDALIT
jgi:hypothetical protein|tara:strand:- start:2529 stop:3029 length:501 start_codon:yes stop_codon:yes gene_type:complete